MANEMRTGEKDAVPVEAGQPTSGEIQPSASGNAATRMVKIADEQVTRYYRDGEGRRYVQLGRDGQSELHTLEAEELKNWFSLAYYERHSEVPPQSAVANAMPLLKHRCDATTACKVHLRVAKDGEMLYLDHKCEGDKVLAIGGGLLKEVGIPERILFKRPRHMLPHGAIDLSAEPQEVWRFLDVINAPEAEDSKMLLLVWLVSGFLPNMARPLLIMTGPQGTAKSTTFRYLRSIIDPSSQQALAPPRSQNDLNVVLNDTYFAPFDNVSNLTTLADPLCRVVTGESVSQRKLYTDESTVSFNYQRLIAVNGVDIPVTQPDLLDRVLWLALQPISPERRKPESVTNAAFEQVRPAIIGGCLNTIARVLQQSPYQGERLPRLADWAATGALIAAELGCSPEAFLTAYDATIQENREFALQDRAFISITRELVLENAKPNWTVRPCDLLIMATDRAKQYQLSYKREPSWPANQVWVTRRLNQSATDLQSAGITFDARVPMPDQQKGIRFVNHNHQPTESGVSFSPSEENVWSIETTRVPIRLVAMPNEARQ